MTSTSRVGFLFSSFSREEQGLISRGTRSEEGSAACPGNGSLNCSPGLSAVLPRKSRLSPSHCLSLSHQTGFQLISCTVLQLLALAPPPPEQYPPWATAPRPPDRAHLLYAFILGHSRRGGAVELDFTLTTHKIKPQFQLWRCRSEDCLCRGHGAVMSGLPSCPKPCPLGEEMQQRCWKSQGACSPRAPAFPGGEGRHGAGGMEMQRLP